MEKLPDWLNEWEKLMDEESKKLDEARTEINTRLGKVPVGAQRQIGFDMLFGVNPGVVKIMIHKAVTELITYFKSKEGNDGKKDNRDC